MTAATFPDFIVEPVVILSVGINPSLHAVRAGYPFAFPRNRFWPALNASHLLTESLVPGAAAMQILATRYGIGFTDVVKRPTPGLKALKAPDFARWAPLLHDKIKRFKPAIVWFHGKVAAREFLTRTLAQEVDIHWGLQDFSVIGAHCFISPNPSPANAGYALADIVASYDELADLRARLAAVVEK